MSHIVDIQNQVRDADAFAAACRRLGLGAPERGVARLFSGSGEGLLVKLPGWSYPVVFDTENGGVRFDNYEGHWGDRAELGRSLQVHAVENAVIEARRRGHAVWEQTLADGNIKLTVSAGGA